MIKNKRYCRLIYSKSIQNCESTKSTTLFSSMLFTNATIINQTSGYYSKYNRLYCKVINSLSISESKVTFQLVHVKCLQIINL